MSELSNITTKDLELELESRKIYLSNNTPVPTCAVCSGKGTVTIREVFKRRCSGWEYEKSGPNCKGK